MKYTVEVSGEPPVVAITSSGRAHVADFLGVEEFLSDSRFQPGMLVLADHSALDLTELSSADVQTIGRAYRDFLDRVGQSRIAIVVSQPFAFGLARMAEAYAGQPAPNQRIFYSRDEAISWLRA